MADEHNFFALISRMKYIDRWALMRNTETENIQEHSHQVAVLAHALAVIANQRFGAQLDPGRVAVAALYHDATEIITGDMPTPIKYYNSTLRDSYKPHLRESDPEIHAYVKAADKLSAYLKCVEEVKAGNSEFRLAKEQTWAALMDKPLPALQYFIDQFLPSFELTLDELQK